MKAAIVTTVINVEAVIDFFISYHLNIGFDHIFLFFDDPSETSIQKARAYPNVTVVLCDDALREKWSTTRLLRTHKAYSSFIDREVMARQILNAEIACQMAVDMGIDWILHIDGDELFYSPRQSVKDHFSELDKKGVGQVTYANHEAVTERLEYDNFFKEATLFKRNFSLLTEAQIALLMSDPIFGRGSRYFHYYSIGKSAAVVRDGLVPVSVHKFMDEDDPLQEEPSILHYPLCGLQNLARKYRTIGFFDDKWFGEVNIGHHIPFHLEARNAVHRNDPDLLLQFYTHRVMINDEEKITRFLNAGVFFRVSL